MMSAMKMKFVFWFAAVLIGYCVPGRKAVWGR